MSTRAWHEFFFLNIVAPPFDLTSTAIATELAPDDGIQPGQLREDVVPAHEG
jgi:hypothetical protein